MGWKCNKLARTASDWIWTIKLSIMVSKRLNSSCSSFSSFLFLHKKDEAVVPHYHALFLFLRDMASVTWILCNSNFVLWLGGGTSQ